MPRPLRYALISLAFASGLAACSAGAGAPMQSRTSMSPPSPSSGLTELAATKAVVAVASVGTVPPFPDQPGTVACVIEGGGPAPGLRIQGSCETAADGTDSNRWAVTLTEYWDASRFHYEGEPSAGELSHWWRYLVDVDGKVTLMNNGGNFPPQDVF